MSQITSGFVSFLMVVEVDRPDRAALNGLSQPVRLACVQLIVVSCESSKCTKTP